MLITQRIFTAIFITLLSLSGFSQPPDAAGLTENEGEVIRLVNYVRTQPADFAAEYLLPIKDQSRDALECYNELMTANPLKVLITSKALSLSARDHAIQMGKAGKVGHFSLSGKSPSDRVKKYATFTGMWAGAWENCSYGYENALDIVLQLLIDKNVPDRGHRKNIMNENVCYIGVSVKPHKTYGFNCVMDMANALTEK